VAAIPPVCFDSGCQQVADQAFTLSLAIPMAIAAIAAAFVAQPAPKELKESGKVFEDPATGVVFGAPGGEPPLRDDKVSSARIHIRNTCMQLKGMYVQISSAKVHTNGTATRCPVGCALDGKLLHGHPMQHQVLAVSCWLKWCVLIPCSTICT
jgi:hypothetical protein